MGGMGLQAWMKGWVRCGGALLLAAAVSSAAFGANKTPAPETRLKFEALGMPQISVPLLGAGESLLSVNFVDEKHLLVTFRTRGLVPRVQDDPEGDQDRMVKAELVELPAGKIVSQTEWHLHDHGRYLWPLGDGRFMLRIRQDLSVFAPVVNLEHDPWARTAFVHRRGDLAAVEISSDNRLVSLITESTMRVKQAQIPSPSRGVNVSGGGDLVDRTASFVYIDLYRMAGKGSAASPVELQHAGVVRAPEAIRLPIDGDGYLRTTGGAKGNWKVSFEGYDGGSRSLGPVSSACPPVLTLTSRSQLLAFTCRGSMTQNSITLQAFDFAGHEMWEEPIGEVSVTPSFAYAPESGRFAMSRILPQATPPQGAVVEAPVAPAQELRIYQMQSGDLLLKLALSPAFRTGENFDLSPDGMRAVVVHDGEFDLYRLSELSKRDREDLADVAKMEPPRGGSGPVNLRKLAEDDNQQVPLKDAEGAVAPPTAAAAITAAGPAAKAQEPDMRVVQNGDSVAPRKPPTLLNPGEKAEYRDKKEKADPQ